MGSNDYFAPTLRNPLRYLLPDDGQRNTHTPQLPWRELRSTFTDAGWVDLTNTRTTLRVGETTFAFAGVDDPHLEYDRLDEVAGPADVDADVRLGVTHAPYLRVLDQFAGDGYDAVIAGHTHGGQVCLPGVGALTTNCDLDNARARGLHRHPADSRPGDPGSAWLHVSAGLGTSPYAQVRLACRPEATLLTLTAPRLRPISKAGSARVCSPCSWAGPVPGRGDRAVAQLGSARRSGRRGRRFKSCQPDRVMSQDIGDTRTCECRSGCCSFRGLRVGPVGAPVGW